MSWYWLSFDYCDIYMYTRRIWNNVHKTKFYNYDIEETPIYRGKYSYFIYQRWICLWRGARRMWIYSLEAGYPWIRNFHLISTIVYFFIIILPYRMSNLAHRQSLIQAKRKTTPWREFVMEICSWLNLTLYKNSWLISRYPKTDRINNVISVDLFEWERDRLSLWAVWYSSWNIFLQEYMKLFTSTTIASLIDFWGNENSMFADSVQWSKNVYLSFIVVAASENVCYSFNIKDKSHNVFNGIVVTASSNVYMSVGIHECHNIFYSKYIYNSSNIRLGSNLQGCDNCVDCYGLQNKSYCILNKQYTKEEFETKKKEILSSKAMMDIKYKKMESISWFSITSPNSTWWFLLNCDNAQNCFMSSNLKNCNNVLFASSYENNENYNDIICAWRSEHMYGGVATGTFSAHVYNSAMIANSSYIFHSYALNNCSFCLGCIGLKNKSYCILNKQYTKEEWYEKVDEIFAQMEKDWTLWEFFPATMNPFYFNDTAAYLIDPSFTKEEVTAKWYLRRDEPIKVDIPEGMEVVKISELWTYEWFDNEWNRTINADILKKVIQDEQWNIYRIIPMEYKFLVKHGLPLPRKHWLERMKENFRIQ